MTAQYRSDVMVAMPDGIRLATDVWTPAAQGSWPVLLQRTPYDKSSPFVSQHVVNLDIGRALKAGFAVVIQDTRGRFGSEGSFVPFVQEAHDGEATIEWVRRQGFCSGNICMYGASYIGATQMLAASRHPEGLIAVAPQLTTARYHSPWVYWGGALQLGFVQMWIAESFSPQYLAEWYDGPDTAFLRLPILSDRLAELLPFAAEWMAHPTSDSYWESIDPTLAHDASSVSGLHIAGWNDVFVEGSLEAYQSMRTRSATQQARDAQRLIVGPWSHGNMSDWQGEGWLGFGASAANVDLTTAHLDFYSAALEGTTPDGPRVRYFRSGSNSWEHAHDWPIPNSVVRSLYLAGDRTLTPAPPTDDPPDVYLSDPRTPVPTVGGATFLPGLQVARNSGHRNQSVVERRDDVLTYTSEPLVEDLEVTGQISAELFAMSTAVDCDWTVRLCDVSPDGVSIGIVDGIQRARYRDGEAKPLAPGEVERFTVLVGSTSHLFMRGHSIRVQVASSNFPRFDRNPQTWVDPVRAVEDDFAVAEQTVFHSASMPSRVVLPVRPDPP